MVAPPSSSGTGAGSVVAEFRDRYLRRCGELYVSPLKVVLEMLNACEEAARRLPAAAVDANTEHGVAEVEVDENAAGVEALPAHALVLPRGHTLDHRTVQALCEPLYDDTWFTSIEICEAMISDDGCVALASALRSNTTVTRVVLTGNNIRAEGASALAGMLRVNTTLTHLVLEFNAIGVWDTGLVTLAEALGVNRTLTHIDLRNNRISPAGGRALADAVRVSLTLQSLQLSWNSLGLLGSKALAEALRVNQSLLELSLDGNEAPPDILAMISVCLQRNAENARLREGSDQQVRVLQQENKQLRASMQRRLAEAEEEVEHVRTEAKEEVSSLQRQLETSMQHVAQGNRALAELQARFDLHEADHAATRAKLAEVEEAAKQTAHENAVVIDKLTGEVRRYAEVKTRLEQVHTKAMEAGTKRMLELEARLREANLRHGDVSTRLDDAIADLDIVRKESHARIRSLEEELRLERGRLADRETELKQAHASTLARINEQNREALDELQHRLRGVEEARARAEEQLEQQRGVLVSEKLSREESMLEVESRLKVEESTRLSSLESKLTHIQAVRDSLQAQVETQAKQLNELRQKEIERQQSHEGELSSERDQRYETYLENQRLRQEVNKLRTELGELRAALQTETAARAEMEGELRELRAGIDARVEETKRKLELRTKHAEAKLLLKEEQLAQALDEARSKSRELDRMKHDATARLAALESTIDDLFHVPSAPATGDPATTTS